MTGWVVVLGPAGKDAVVAAVMRWTRREGRGVVATVVVVGRHYFWLG